MKRILAIAAFLFISTAALAVEPEGGEGYARPTFKEVTQTVVLMGGLDINKTNVADEYGRLVYCPLYKRSYENDVEWNRIRSQIITRVTEKKEPYRVLYEVTGEFKLGRYDFGRQYFPLSPGTAMINVGSISLFSASSFTPYCGLTTTSHVFPANVLARLNRPLTVKELKVPQEKVERLVARLAEMKKSDMLRGREDGMSEDEAEMPKVYGRIRFRVTDVPELEPIAGNIITRADLNAEVTAVDFFLDPGMTKYIGSQQLKK